MRFQGGLVNTRSILTINAGSSSIKFALYGITQPLQRGLAGKLDRIGLPGTALVFRDPARGRQVEHRVDLSNRGAADFLIGWLEDEIDFAQITAIGHRVVHGMNFTDHQRVTPEMIDKLRSISTYFPDHLPREVELIEAFCRRHPRLPQVACFDTVFHRTLPQVARLLPIPRRYTDKGIRRYGFHGLSYAYLMEELARVAGTEAARGRVILAHLGNGASLAAVRGGESIDTTMAFTPASGLPMGTRPGDLDPGVAWHLMQAEKLTPGEFNRLIHHESGLIGISGTSSDMRDLLKHEAGDIRAAEAVAVFCYHVKKWIGACAAALGGLDTLVFSGGIGENAPVVRARICEGLEFLGITLAENRNAANESVISTETSRVCVRVIRTDEEWMVANTVCRLLAEKPEGD